MRLPSGLATRVMRGTPTDNGSTNHAPFAAEAATVEQRSWIRSLYLYLAALFGLVLLSIGSVRLLDMGLRAWIFTEADSERRIYAFQPPMPPPTERLERLTG